VTFVTATVQATATSGDRAAATLSNGALVQLRRSATGEWLIDTLGEDGLPAELRRKLRLPGP
jgi:ketosteroid isomerase-like protein